MAAVTMELKQTARKQIKEALKRLTPDMMAKESEDKDLRSKAEKAAYVTCW